MYYKYITPYYYNTTVTFYLHKQRIGFHRYGFKTGERNGGKKSTPKRVRVDRHTTHIQ